MKKFIALLMSIIMVLTFSSVSVIAASDDNQVDIKDVLGDDVLSVSLANVTANSHSDVTVNLTLNGNPGFSVMILSLDHGSEAITLKSASVVVDDLTLEYSNQKGGSTLAFYHLGSNCVATGTIATLTFSVGAFSGDAEIVISAEEGNVCNAAAEIIEPEFTNGLISVACSHTYIFKDRVEPSCSKTGAVNYECTICKAISTTVIEKAAHTYSSEKVVVLEPDCDSTGIKAYKCEFCGELKDQEAIAALGHKFADDSYIVAKEETCTEKGSKYRVCYVCNEHVTEEIAALGHDEGTWRITTPGDCTEAGKVSRYCNRCDFVLEEKVKEQSGHFMGWAVTVKATCTDEGKEEYMCLICGGEKGNSRITAKLDHVHGEEVVAKEPTCSQKGTLEVHCKVCDGVYETKEIDTVPHVKNTLTVITAPTSEAEGNGEYKCKVCKETLEEVTLDKVYGEIYAENVTAAVGKKASVKVFIKNNSGFSAGIVRIRYDETSLIFNNVNAGEITGDITVGTPAIGEIAVLLSLSDAEYTKDGLMFTINFTLTQDADNGKVELFYDAQTDFADRVGNRVFFNMKSAEIEIMDCIPGDVNGDLNVDTTDLATIKLYLAGLTSEVAPGADADADGNINTGDLATLKLMLAGLYR